MPFPENLITDAAAEGQKKAQEQSAERAGDFSASFPRYKRTRRGVIFNALSALAAGTKAAQGAIERGDPLSAALLSAGGALQAPTEEEFLAAREAQLADSTLKILEATPIEKVSPALLNEYPELQGLPLAVVSRISPFLRQQKQYSDALSLTLLRDRLRDEDREFNDFEKEIISKAFHTTPANLKGVRTTTISNILPQIFMDSRSGEIVIAPPKTKMITPPGAVEAQDKISRGEAYLSSLERLEGILETVPSGRVVGAGAELINKLSGQFPQIRTARGLIGALTPQTARFIGGDVGNLNEQEQMRAAAALPMINGTLEERRRGIAILRELANDVIARERAKFGFKGGESRVGPSPRIEIKRTRDDLIQVKTSDGITHTIYRNKLDEAQKRDPGLRVLNGE